jgi:ABC-type nitrate/sulfonate/bicarbonate transport system ATPase subunit
MAMPGERQQLDIRDISKSFAVDGRRVDALADVSLSVADGEFVSLVGPSGCGKSTLLRLIAGLDVPDQGSVAVGGAPVSSPSLKRGIIFQDHRLFPWLSVEENVRLGLHKSGLDKAKQRDQARALLDLVGLAGFETARPHQLSGGMAQRAAIARGLAPRPDILLLDEPLGALDSLTRGLLQAELLRIWRHERTTMVMVTHDVDEAIALSDRIVVMEPRPGRVRTILPVEIPHPRRRTDPRIAAIREELLAHVHAGQTPGEGPAPILEAAE